MVAVYTDVHCFVEEKLQCKQLRYLNLICTFRDPEIVIFLCKIMGRNSNTEALGDDNPILYGVVIAELCV